ncbi:hypothetical protein E1B28_013520 [Marasmius oreades]|uniref:Zn(2)-C6 fungal-type domain-containing protein n=1 Tax=Marasmius oreades TaxID=181124 RepID=A0A9P7RQQ7_9AGAR|nr:uncharacterized protein E1B28_013520 [Marasmius oreades]KAG7087565.1 hypothetical protein E1B28_013520 [Marasmius oreades]
MHKNSPPRYSSSKPLKRGKACLTCRFLKIKCDGARPICGPCQRHPKDDPCEFADGPGRSRTRVLEDTVSRLEARLREYENPDETPPVALHNPYSSATLSEDRNLHLAVPSIPFLKGEPLSSQASPSSPFASLSPISAPSPPSGSSTVRTGSSRSPGVELEEPSLPMIRHLLDTFFVHSSTFGFFLNTSRIYSSTLVQKPLGDPSRPTPGLLRTVYLLGVHLSTALQPGEAHSGQEHPMLLLALRETATDLTTTHPQRFIHTIQAETLLSYYFFRTGNIIEAKRHASSAASVVLACGFHRVHSSSSSTWGSSSSPVAVGPTGSTPLPESKDAVEEGERINAFWTVFTLYRNLAAAVNSASDVCGVFDAPGMQVDTPFPLDMESYKEGVLPPAGTSTVWNYLNHVPSLNEEYERSLNTFVVKTSLLFHQAVFLAAQYNPDISQKDSQTFIAAFQSLNHLLETTKAQLGPLPTDTMNPSTRSLYLSHSLLYGATIKLHGIFSYSDTASRQACVDAAKTMLKSKSNGGIDTQQLGIVNPIMGTLWTLACQVLIEEVVRIRQGWPGEAEFLLTHLHEGFSALSFFSASSDLMSEYSSKIRKLLYDYRSAMSGYQFKESISPSQTPSSMVGPTGNYNSNWSPESEPSSLEGDDSEHGSSGGNFQLHSQTSSPVPHEPFSGMAGYPDHQYYTTPRYQYTRDHYNQQGQSPYERNPPYTGHSVHTTPSPPGPPFTSYTSASTAF